MQRDRCGGCGSAALEPFLDLGKTPLADAFPKTEDEPETWYPLQVTVCAKCWLVQLLEVVPDTDLFGADYGFYSSTSPSIVEAHQAYASKLFTAYGGQAKRLTVEIACNDGSLLQHFAAAGCDTLGIDPAAGPAQAARSRGLEVVTAPFTYGLADQLLDSHGPAGLILANNVLAHVADLNDFLGGVVHLLAGDGVAVFEVQYLPDLLAGNQFDHIYHEHRYFFSTTSLLPLLARHGLALQSIEHIPAQGGSIRFAVARASGIRGYWPSTGLPIPPEGYLTSMASYRAMQGRVEYLRDRLLALLAEEEAAGRKVFGYAASAKSTTLLNYCGIGTDQIERVVDTTPAKIGRFTPGTHIPIAGPGEHPDTYLLMAWNYLSGVLRREREFTAAGGKFIIPIPMPVIL